jgi:hypothetical protein
MKLWLVVSLYDRDEVKVWSTHTTRKDAEFERRGQLLNEFTSRVSVADVRNIYGWLEEEVLEGLIDTMENGGVPSAWATQDVLEEFGAQRSMPYAYSVESVDVTAEQLMEILAVAKAAEGD